jgi:hypothetical protein
VELMEIARGAGHEASESVVTPACLTDSRSSMQVPPDPAQVNARIAAIMEEYPDFWRVPEALAEAAALWGGGANEQGVFCRYDREVVARLPDGSHAAVLIAQGGNGLFGYGLEYGFGTGGGNVFPSVWREAFGSRADARAAAVADLVQHIGGHPDETADKRRAELLRKVRREGQQRLLFE